MAIPGSNHPKQQLRKEMRALLKSSSPDSDPAISKVRDWLKSHPGLQTIAIYSALPGEIDLTSLVDLLPQIRWVFPRVQESELVLHQVRNRQQDLKIGAFGIREPLKMLPTVTSFDVDAFFCPGLAFDEYGGRLGRGRGFYDRMLESARPGALKIGVCRKEQIVPETHGEPHDIFMDEVISA